MNFSPHVLYYFPLPRFLMLFFLKKKKIYIYIYILFIIIFGKYF